MKAILFNGPPGCGKDAAVDGIRLNVDDLDYEVIPMKVAYPLKMALKELLCISSVSVLDSRKDKNIPYKPLSTIRKELIALSEEFVKVRYGNNFFGVMAVERMKRMYTEYSSPELFAFSDCGFKEEVTEIINFLGKDNVLLIRLSRDGCTFSNDSRSYIHYHDLTSYDIHNDSDNVHEFHQRIARAVSAWLQE